MAEKTKAQSLAAVNAAASAPAPGGGGGGGAMATPLGTLKHLPNKLMYCVADLTDNAADAGLGKIKEAPLPKLKEAQESGAEKKAMLFSHLCENPQELLALKDGFIFNREMRPRPDVCGVVFDTRAVDEMKKGDVFFDTDRDSGNIIAAFVMPFGWNTAHDHNEVCHGCGAFPARIACQRCTAGRFCSNLCYLQSSKDGEAHSPKVCDEFVRGKVAAAYIRQYDANMPPGAEPAAAASANEDAAMDANDE